VHLNVFAAGIHRKRLAHEADVLDESEKLVCSLDMRGKNGEQSFDFMI
jgi:hypothetical protein